MKHHLTHGRVVTTIAPADEPITLADLKRQIRVDTSDEDDQLTAYIKAARELLEEHTERALVTQTRQLYLDRFPSCQTIEIPCTPVTSIESIEYIDPTGQLQELDPSSYVADLVSSPARIRPAYGRFWPAIRYQMNAVIVTFEAGQDVDEVPERAKQAIRLLAGHWYANRETVLIGTISKEVEFSFNALAGQLRWH
ncbi:phiE125 gp8 hypothetical protein (plasmid) [Planctopirus limnophila DSM 3776]|uniref:Phage gp6-like head-tail connector protein n=1 Tax=Planctopirus limnophila (strain ATCC 43296 / DSM 3776 / IFAM 1008 / Mu 290) TaxID=521674 RepID=D5SZE2_PLAL2|nr:head-tail connector protein [Planctopirus limnophila]ADG70062.1 phiE125 gp8 hypothetical protein [Planctopirus limnophila DSM 3776]